MSRLLTNVWELCKKEWLSLLHDTVLMVFIVFSFSLFIYTQARGITLELKHTSVGIIDEDKSPLSERIAGALLPPYFGNVENVTPAQAEAGLDAARYSFVLRFPPRMEADVRAGKSAEAQLMVDATLVGQAQIGVNYIQDIIQQELLTYFNARALAQPRLGLVVRGVFNQTLDSSWFAAINGMIQNVTMLAVLLTAAAVLRERESGTIEHLLVMPVSMLEISLSKVISNGLVILLATYLSIELTIQRWIGVDIRGSVPMFLLATTLYLFFATGLGLFLGTVSRNMPQMGLLFILTILPMNLLSGGYTPLESMPETLQKIMAMTPTANYIKLAQGILFRDASFSMIWPEMIKMTVIGIPFFLYSVRRFHSFS